jgi:hypothetical protein
MRASPRGEATAATLATYQVKRYQCLTLEGGGRLTPLVTSTVQSILRNATQAGQARARVQTFLDSSKMYTYHRKGHPEAYPLYNVVTMERFPNAHVVLASRAREFVDWLVQQDGVQEFVCTIELVAAAYIHIEVVFKPETRVIREIKDYTEMCATAMRTGAAHVHACVLLFGKDFMNASLEQWTQLDSICSRPRFYLTMALVPKRVFYVHERWKDLINLCERNNLHWTLCLVLKGEEEEEELKMAYFTILL